MLTIRTNKEIIGPTTTYFEYYINNAGPTLNWIGVVDETIELEKWMGGQPGGWSYGSRGCICHNSKVNEEGVGDYSQSYGEKFGVGDTIGVLVHLTSNDGSIYFYKNGKELGQAFTGVTAKVLYPAISIFQYSEISIICGSKPDLYYKLKSCK